MDDALLPGFFVYVLVNGNGRFYVGQSHNPDYRLTQHNNREVRWTRRHGPWTRVHLGRFSTRAEAMGRERQLKSGRASQELKRGLTQRLAGADPNDRASPSAKD